MSYLKPVAVLGIAVVIYFLLSKENFEDKSTINGSEKVNGGTQYPYHNVLNVQDSNTKAFPGVDITGINIKKKPKQFTHAKFDSIKIVDWKKDSMDLSTIFNSSKPAKLMNSPATTWKALNWDLPEMTARWPVLENVMMTENSGLHIHKQEREKGGMLGADETKPYHPDVIYEMTFPKFLYYSASPHMFLHYTTNFRVMESLAQIERDTSWRDFLVEGELETSLIDRADPKTSPLRHPPPTLSIAHSGVVLQARLSEPHITRVQLKGRTRYLLFPPSKHSSLYLYPYIHTSFHQSQVLMESATDRDDEFSKFAAVRPIEVVLEPGQALYIPPYWLVRSEFLGLSMVLDIKSLSRVQIRLAAAQFVDIPLGNFSSSPEDRVVAAQIYVVHFLSRLNGLRSPKTYMQHHYSARYASLYPLDGLYMLKALKKFSCYANEEERYKSVIARMNKLSLQNSAQYVADILNDQGISQGARWIWVGDYVDRIARWAMNDPSKAPLFISSCVNFDKKVPVISPTEETLGPDVLHIGEKDDDTSK